MPGEKPSSIWRPKQAQYHRRRTPPIHLPRIEVRIVLRWLIAAIVIFALRQIWLITATHVTVVVNGQPVEVGTHRTTVAGAVRLAGVEMDDTVYVQPAADTPLEEGMVITLGSLRPVIVHADGQTLISTAQEVDPQALIASLGIVLGPQDVIRIDRAMRPSSAEIDAHPELANAPSLPREITVVRPQQVIVHEIDALSGTQTDVSFSTTAATLGRALMDAGYALYEADLITPALTTPIGAPIEVTIERAAPVTVQADGITYAARTHQTTVGDLFIELGLALTGNDYALPGPAAPIKPGQMVRLVRVHTEEVSDDRPLPFDTQYVPDPDMVLDQQRVIAEGVPGVLSRIVRRRYEDGRLVSEAVISEYTASPPHPQIVGYGTQVVIHTLDTAQGPIQYWRKLHVLATSYSPSTAGHKQPGDPFFGVSATGAEVVRGIVATDPRVIPLGTFLYVPKYGSGRALDVGGAVKGFRIDLGYDDANLVLWNTWVDVYLLVPVPSPDEMVWVLPEN
jgi:uncharacterized protein YabE (DUF348 family)